MSSFSDFYQSHKRLLHLYIKFKYTKLRTLLRTNPNKEPDVQSADIGYLSITEIHEEYRSGKMSPRELVEVLLARMQLIDVEETIDV